MADMDGVFTDLKALSDAYLSTQSASDAAGMVYLYHGVSWECMVKISKSIEENSGKGKNLSFARTAGYRAGGAFFLEVKCGRALESIFRFRESPKLCI